VIAQQSMKGADVIWRTMGDEELGEQRQHVVAIEPPGDQDCQTFPTELIDHHQHPESSTVMRALLDEVISPDMVTPTWPKPNAGAVIQPETAQSSAWGLGCFAGTLNPSCRQIRATRLAFTCQP